MNSVSEQIDERILRLLGLDDVFDLDYDTYLTLLKEVIVAGSDKLPQEELALLANERKRIRGKKGRFKPKKEKITADKIATTRFLKPTNKNLVLPESISKPDTSQNLIGFSKPLESIAKTLSAILKFNKKTNEEERKDKESEKRTKREESLEGFKKGVSAISGAARKLLAPFQSIIDRIWRFIFFTLLGRAFTQLMEWLGDPKNKRKIEVLGRFLKDWWPTLLGAAVLFLTPFGKFVRSTLKLVGFLTGRLIGSIPKIAGAIKGLGKVLLNPFFAVPAAAVGLSVAANEITGQRKAAPIQAENKARAQTGRGLGVQGIGGVGDMGPTTPYGLLQGAMNGGTVMDGYSGIDKNTGERVSGFGPDTQAIIAQPGEIVINKKTVDAVGPEYFLGLNRMHGGPGANKPKMGKLYNTGGMVGKQSPNISASDYNALLAISALESDKAQGRADVAQSLYNRLHAASNYKTNFSQTSNTLKGLITASGQYQPTFSNSSDWMNITDKKSAAIAIMNSEKGRKYKWNIAESMRQINATEMALKNPSLQANAQKHVGGRAYFLGISQQDNMKPGDVLRDTTSNFFSPWYLEGSQYDKERRNVAAPIPSMLIPKMDQKKSKSKPKGKGFWANFANMMPTSLPFKGGGFIRESTGMNIPGATADRQLAALQPGEYVLPAGTVSKLGVPLIDQIVAMTDYDSTPAKLGKKPINRSTITPLPRSGMGGMMTLPPITQSAGGSMGFGSAAGSRVPSFSTISPSSGGERSMNASIYGIVG